MNSLKHQFNSLDKNNRALVMRKFAEKTDKNCPSTFYKKINGERPVDVHEREFLIKHFQKQKK